MACTITDKLSKCLCQMQVVCGGARKKGAYCILTHNGI